MRIHGFLIGVLVSLLLASCANPGRYEAKLYTGEKKPSEISVIDADQFVIVRQIDGLPIHEKVEFRLRFVHSLHRGYRYSVDPGRHTLEVFHGGKQFGDTTVKLAFDALPGRSYWIYAGLDCPRRGAWTPYVRDITDQAEPDKKFAMTSTHGCPPADAL